MKSLKQIKARRRKTLKKETQTNIRKPPSAFDEIYGNLKTTGWGKDSLTQNIEKSFCNIGVSFINLRAHFELLQKTNEIFVDSFAQMSTNTLENGIAHFLFGRSFGCFFCAVRLSSSGQMTETWILLRALIENCLYAFYIFKSPKHADIWVNRHKDNDSKKKCMRTFVVRNILKELKKNSSVITNEAKKLYDMAIDWGAHPNERSLFPNIVPKQGGSGLSLRLVNPEPAFIKTSVIYTIRTSLLTFRIFTLVFPEVFNQPTLDIKIKNLDKQSKSIMAELPELLRQLVRNKQNKAR